LSEPLKKQQIGGLIISPTRELATQISEVLDNFLDNESVQISQMLMIGGRNLAKDLKKVKETNVSLTRQLVSVSSVLLLRSSISSCMVSNGSTRTYICPLYLIAVYE
jgi:hypothetical protein